LDHSLFTFQILSQELAILMLSCREVKDSEKNSLLKSLGSSLRMVEIK